MRLRLCAIGALLLLLGCEEDLGPCGNMEMLAARTPVWDIQGLPSYQGQALLDRSCGSGSFCHSVGAEGGDRFGVPGGRGSLRASTSSRMVSVCTSGSDDPSFICTLSLASRT